MKTVFILSTLLLSCSFNTGHRLGGGAIKEFPENTTECMTAYLKDHGDDFRFQYLELDIRESWDSVLFVFHDKTIGKKAPFDSFGNREFLDSLRPALKSRGVEFISGDEIPFAALTSQEIRTLNLTGDSLKISLFSDVLKQLQDLKYTGRLLVEVKQLQSDLARKTLVKHAAGSDPIEIAVIALKENFLRAFPDEGAWCGMFREHNVKVQTIGLHRDLCRVLGAGRPGKK